MNESLVDLLRCPRCRNAVTVWNVGEKEGENIVEGTLACGACGGTYAIRSTLPVMLPQGRRAVDDFATALALEAETGGFSRAVRRLADGVVSLPLEREYDAVVSPTEAREGRYRASEAFWEAFSRNRLVQQQQNAINTHWDAMEELWVRTDVNFADAILDVGTGWGGAFQPLLEYAPQDARVVGLDTAFLNLRVAQGRAERAQLGQAAFVVGDCNAPPFREGLFDAVVSWFGVGCVPAFRHCLEGIKLMLGPGRAFACAWTPLVNDMVGLASPADLIGMAARLDIPVEPDETVAVMEETGFEEIEMVTVGPIFVLSGRATVL